MSFIPDMLANYVCAYRITTKNKNKNNVKLQRISHNEWVWQIEK